MEDILNRILKSNTTLIGYDIVNEINVNRLVNLVPNLISFTGTGRGMHTGATVNAFEILAYFGSVSHKRDYRLSTLLDEQETQYVVVDLSNLIFIDDLAMPGTGKTTLKSYLKTFVSELSSMLYNLSTDESPVKFKLILLSLTYSTPVQLPSGNNIKISFRGGESPMYMSDLVIQISDDTLSVIKDRISPSNVHVTDFKERFRDLTIKQIFNEADPTT